MKPKHITTEELMAELNYSEYKEFKSILKRNGLPQLKRGGLIERKDADQISLRLRSRKVDWYQLGKISADRAEVGPFERKEKKGTLIKLDQWFKRLGPNIGDQKRSLIGLVCNGGFLRGPAGKGRKEPFAIRLRPGVNILIGDRGSGKSTALSLMGLLAPSTIEDTDALVTRLLQLLDSASSDRAKMNARMRRQLKSYGVQEYACFFSPDAEVRAFYVSVQKKEYSIARREGASWSFTPIEEHVLPSMQILQQGEVIRLADDTDRWYLNKLLDQLYPELYWRRKDLADLLQGLARQMRELSPSTEVVAPDAVHRFARDRIEELSGLKDRTNVDAAVDYTLMWLRRYQERLEGMIPHNMPERLSDLLKLGETGRWFVYLQEAGPGIKECAERIQYIRRASETQLQAMAVEAGPSLALSQRRAPGEAEAEGAKPLPSAMLRRLLLNAELATATSILHKQYRAFTTWRLIYSRKGRVKCNERVLNLLHNYKEMLTARLGVLEVQSAKCEEVTNMLQGEDEPARWETKQHGRLLQKYRRQIEAIEQVAELYEQVTYATLKSRPVRVRAAALRYDTLLKTVLDNLGHLADSDGQSLLFDPITVLLKQGNADRPFERLSFGQKSGIMLKTVLETTPRDVIIIDQPEDNLDASSVVGRLAPTLKKLGKNKQIIIATHNSNLVMGLPDSELLAMESTGANGCIKIAGSLTDRAVVNVMLSILEGGVPSFEKKIRMYEDFVNKLSGQIHNLDISLIESSFRKRTIDGLRNFLQPPISEHEMLNVFRHEVKNARLAGLDIELEGTRQAARDAQEDPSPAVRDLATQVDNLCNRLGSHLTKLSIAIEDLRLMDTQPTRQAVPLQPLVETLANEYRSALRPPRKVDIVVDSEHPDVQVFVDPDHLKLIFRNLIHNALRATESRALDLDRNAREKHRERLRFRWKLLTAAEVVVRLEDNGCGMPGDIRSRLYTERCTTQVDRDHGLGGVIIAKLLQLNGGSIRIVRSFNGGAEIGTEQEMFLPLSCDSNSQK